MVDRRPQTSGSPEATQGTPQISTTDAGLVYVYETDDGVFTAPADLGVGDVGFIYTSSPILLPEGSAVSQNYLAQGSAELKPCADVHQYPVSGLSIADNGHEVPIVTGTVSNDEDEEMPLVEVAVVFLDNEDQVLGVTSDFVLELAPGATQDFEIVGNLLPVGCTMPLISDYDVIAVAPKY